MEQAAYTKKMGYDMNNGDDYDLFYKYKNIRIYKILHNQDHYMTYLYVYIELEDEQSFRGKMIQVLDIRKLSTYDKAVSGMEIIKNRNKIIPKIIREAKKKGELTKDLFVPFDAMDCNYNINWDL